MHCSHHHYGVFAFSIGPHSLTYEHIQIANDRLYQNVEWLWSSVTRADQSATMSWRNMVLNKSLWSS